MKYQHACRGAEHAEDGSSYKHFLRDAPHPALRIQLVSPVEEHDKSVYGKQYKDCGC